MINITITVDEGTVRVSDSGALEVMRKERDLEINKAIASSKAVERLEQAIHDERQFWNEFHKVAGYRLLTKQDPVTLVTHADPAATLKAMIDDNERLRADVANVHDELCHALETELPGKVVDGVSRADLVAGVRKLAMQQSKAERGWRMPKRGDKVRLVRTPSSPMPPGVDYIGKLKVGDITEVIALAQCDAADAPPYDSKLASEEPDYWYKRTAYGVTVRQSDDGVIKVDTIIPLSMLEPV